MKNFIIMVGPSASGKSTIGAKLQEIGHRYLKSYTTRPRREGEDDSEYYFVTEESYHSFNKKSCVSSFRSYFYCTDYRDLRNSEFKIVDPSDIDDLKQLCDRADRRPVVVGIFASQHTLLERLLNQRKLNSRDLANCYEQDKKLFYGDQLDFDLTFYNECPEDIDNIVNILDIILREEGNHAINEFKHTQQSQRDLEKKVN